MKFFPLVWSGIWRRPIRFILTLLSIFNAFLIFGLLQGLASGINNVSVNSSAAVLMTFSKVSQIEPMPMGHASQIERVAGVEAVTPMVMFAGTYQSPMQPVPAIAVNVDEYLKIYADTKISSAGARAMASTRNGALVSEKLANAYKLKVGDTIPLRSALWINRDGSAIWPVKIVDIFPGQGSAMLVNYAYVDEGRIQAKGTASFFLLKTNDPHKSKEIGARVDEIFANSPHETRTITPKQLAQMQFEQIGDIGLVINSIVSAVFFSILLSVGAVMSKSIRERIPELAILKAIGFTDTGILFLVLSEALIICVASAALGLAVSEAIFPLARKITGIQASGGVILFTGLGFSLILAAMVGLPPAIRAMRLQVVDALRRH